MSQTPNHYDHIIVGGGISGLTLTLLMARRGYKVLLLEQAPRIGGSVARFRRGGVPFDVGFHFTGGLCRNGSGMFDEMLRALEMETAIQPRFTEEGITHRIALPSLGHVHEIPCGIDNYRHKLKQEFPRYRKRIEQYFELFLKVCHQTASMSIRGFKDEPPPSREEDFISMQHVLDQLFPGEALIHTLLSSFCMCHGTRPDEISFADHARIAYALYQSSARVKDGGDAFVRAFSEAFQKLDVDIRCNTTIQALTEIKDKRVNRFILTDGEEITADHCVFTIHPHKIAEMLPPEHTTPAFRRRVEDFEPSAGFFSLFGTMNNGDKPIKEQNAVFSIFPGLDMKKMMSPEWKNPRPMAMLAYDEEVQNRRLKTMTAFELSLPEDVRQWANTRTGQRGAQYAEYKRRKTESMIARLSEFIPELKSQFNYIDSASMLTFRDYLNSPYGSAYGIKQKMAQFNLVGKLPLVNLYAAGQSAILPGVLGAMASAFFVSRYLLGKQEYQQFIEEKLCR